MDREAWCAAVHGLQMVGHNLVTELTQLKECGFLPQSIRLILARELLQVTVFYV